jgi:uncharacterized membrane protein
MVSRGDLRLLLPRQIRLLPADLATVVGLTLCTLVAVFVPWLNGTPLRIVVGLLFVLFLPGYAFIAALFPEAGESPVSVDKDESATDQGVGSDTESDETDTTNTSSESRDRSGIDGIERIALAFGTSIAIVPLLGLGLNFTPWGIRLTPVMVTVAGFTLGATAVAARRRWALPVDERFSVPYREWIDSGRSELLEPETRMDGALNVLLVASVLLAVGSVAYAVAVPPQGEQFSEFYLLTEDEDGELVADGYPTEFVRGESASVEIGIGNNEYEQTNYTVVVELQDVEAVNGTNVTEGQPLNSTNETQVVDREQLGELSTTVAHNETWQQSHELTPTMTGENLRVQYLLYRGSAPAEPTRENAYRSLHLWVDVFATESELEAAQA